MTLDVQVGCAGLAGGGGSLYVGAYMEERPGMASLILTVIGPDRPGLVRALSEAVAARGGSWLESRMARLAGQFAGIVLVEAPQSLVNDLRALEGQGLRIVVQTGEATPAVWGAVDPRSRR